MKKILMLVALCAAVVVGAKFYLEYQHKKNLDNVLRFAGSAAEVSYKDLNVGFDGSVELVGLNITLNETFETFKARSIKLSGFDLWFHFNGKSRLQKGEFPKFLGVDINQFSFPASLYEEQALKQECKSLPGTLLYSSAGFDQVVSNAKLEANLADPFAASIELTASDQISRMSFSLDFNARQANLASVAGGAIPVQGARYDFYLEEEAAQSMIEHCAKKFKISPEAFIEKVVKTERYMLNSFELGFGERASEALASFLQGGKEVVIRSTPSERLKNFNFANSSSPAQIVRMLNLTVSLDGSTVPLRTFNSSASDSAGDIAVEGEDGAEQQGYKRRELEDILSTPDGMIQEKSRPKLSKKRKNNYVNATLNHVSRYIERDIRVSRTKDRLAIEGVLLASTNEVLLIETYLYGGVVKYHVPYKDIVKLEVKKR